MIERDDISWTEAEEMFNDFRQYLLNEAVPTGDIWLAEELGLENNYMTDLLF